MAMKMDQNTINARSEVLASTDHFVCLAKYQAQADPETAAAHQLVLAGNRYWLKAGTIWPSNDASAVGIVYQDYDVTDGDQQIAVIVHGIVKNSALTATLASAAKTAMSLILFV